MPRVLSAQIAHETNTFSQRSTTLQDYRSRAFYLGPQIKPAFSGTNTEVDAHLSAAADHGWELIQPIACSATPSGPTDLNAWQFLRDLVLHAAEENDFDGAVIALHGAMVAEGEDDAEGALLAGLRERLGPDVPIVATVDLHANISDRMAANCNCLLAFKTYPHVDQREVGLNACRVLQHQMSTGSLSSVSVHRLPTLIGCDFGRSDGELMPELLKLANEACQSDPRCKAIALCAGFPWSDVWFAGPTVCVTWSKDVSPDLSLIFPLLRKIWDTRTFSSSTSVTVDEAMQIAKSWHGDCPLVLADSADNPGAGSYGDSVVLLRAMIESGIGNAAFASIADPEVARLAAAEGADSIIKVSLGGKNELYEMGGPLECEAKVESVSKGSLALSGPMMQGLRLSLGTTVVLRIAGIQVIVTSNNMQVFDRSIFLAQGIDPLSKSVLVVKSAQHFRSDFESIAGRIVSVEGGGSVSPKYDELPFAKLRRPIYPLDNVDSKEALVGSGIGASTTASSS